MKDRVRKIDLRQFIDALNELYERGVDYIDIETESDRGDDMDGIHVFFTKDYINPEYIANFEDNNSDIIQKIEEKEDKDIKIKFDDKDINDLI